MTLRVLRYAAYCFDPQEVDYRRHEAHRELASLVPEHMHDDVTWHEDVMLDARGEPYKRISWTIRMEDNELLAPLDD